MNILVAGLLALVGGLLVGSVYFYTRHREREFAADLGRIPRLRELRRTTGLARAAGGGAGLVVVVALVSLDHTGRLMAVSPAVAGVVLLVAVMIGQARARDAARVAGRASLERRGIAHYLPRWPAAVVTAGLVLLAALLGWTTVRAAPSEFGRMSRFAFECMVESGAGVGVASYLRGPFPGSFYSVPVAIAVVILVGLAVVALWSVTMRPRNGSDTDLVRLDDAMRRQAAEGIVGAVGLSVGITLTAVAGLTAMAVAPALCHGNPMPPFSGVVLSAIGVVVGPILALWMLVHLLRPTSGLRP